MEVVASLSQGRTAATQRGLFTYKSVPVIFEPPCNKIFLPHLFIVSYFCSSKHSRLVAVNYDSPFIRKFVKIPFAVSL